MNKINLAISVESDQDVGGALTLIEEMAGKGPVFINVRNYRSAATPAAAKGKTAKPLTLKKRIARLITERSLTPAMLASMLKADIENVHDALVEMQLNGFVSKIAGRTYRGTTVYKLSLTEKGKEEFMDD